MIAYYRFNQSAGTNLRDYSNYGRHGTLMYMDDSDWVPSDAPLTPPAQTEPSRTYLRVVETRNFTNDVKAASAIGTEITGTESGANYHDPKTPHNGYIFVKNTPYNADVYDRQTMKGEIFPVNTHHPDDNNGKNWLEIVWYRVQDGISWPYQPVVYTPKWPTAAKQRIVIAGRQGSEGKDSDGNDQMYKDKNGNDQNYWDPARYSSIKIYNQPDPTKPGYNPNEEHALIAASFRNADKSPQPQAAFALRNDLNTAIINGKKTSEPYVLVQYLDNVTKKSGMAMFKVEKEDSDRNYTFKYPMKAGEPVVPPYPLNKVIGLSPPYEIFGQNGDSNQICYWKDHKGQAWAISGGSRLYSYFWYPLDPKFYYNRDDVVANGDGTGAVGHAVAWLPSGKIASSSDGFPSDLDKKDKAVRVRYDVSWPDDAPVLKAGETLTFPGGEYRADNTASPGLPGVLAWKTGQVVYDPLNPTMTASKLSTDYLVRLAPVLEERTVDFEGAFPAAFSPGNRVDIIQGRYYFKDLPASLKTRLYYDPLTKKLGFKGFINGKTVGDNTLTADPPSVYVLQPNVLTQQDVDTILGIPNGDELQAAVIKLFNLTRDPFKLKDDTTSKDQTPDYAVGLEKYNKRLAALKNTNPGRDAYIEGMFTSWLDADLSSTSERAIPQMALGPGLALMPNGDLLDPVTPKFKDFTEGYITVAENNNPDLGALPVALHVIKVEKEKYRGAVKVVYSDNAFDEKISLRHTADFGGNPKDLQFEWKYREDDGNRLAPDADGWKLFKPLNESVGMSEITLSGAGAALLADNLFFVRYRYNCPKNTGCDAWSDWAGAANSSPSNYQAQLAEGWIKRVTNAINPFEARIRNFSTADSPATYVSMIQQAGPRYEGPVAFNPDKDVIENVGLIELYQTVLERGEALSIDLGPGNSTSGVVTALLLAASRISQFYTLLGNEAYTDALDPTIGVGSSSTEYGSLAPTIFAFQNQEPTLLDEELSLLYGREEEGARPAYNRLLWNFTNDQGEVAYALSYNITDANKDGFLDAADGRTLYPQGHGDAWGHYLTALKGYYDLLTNPYFIWEPRPENLSLEGVVVGVDYLDERKFAETAAAKAKTGREIVNMVYRSRYVENPDGQWQGYKDTNPDRAWGVSGWARRSGQAAMLDWVVANAILPSKSDETGLKKIDRATVPELQEIASQGRQIQQQLDHADTGLNPLGLVADVVPFDIDPARLEPGLVNTATHFEQVAERADKAMKNALTIFDHASDLKNRIRQVANSAEEFTEQTIAQDRDYRNRLIEVFGTPYEGVIGAGKIYPAGYKGPDHYLYMYIDVNEVSNKTMPEPDGEFTAYFKPGATGFVKDESASANNMNMKETFQQFFSADIGGAADFTEIPEEIEINYPVQGAAKYSFQAPTGWGMRKSPGEVQQALIELIKAETELQLAMDAYGDLIAGIQIKMELLKARSDLNAAQVKISDELQTSTRTYNGLIGAARSTASTLEVAAEMMPKIAEAFSKGYPTVVGLSNDPSFVQRAITRLGSAAGETVLRTSALGLNITADALESEKELMQLRSEVKVQKAEYKYDIQQQLKELEVDLGDEAGMRLEIFHKRENMRQISEKYRAVMAKGLRLMEERKAYNAKVAAKTQGKRYEDMAFRLNMNDALSKYRSAFDLAARYLYLAAKAYDYETNLSDNDPASAKPLLTDIMRKRTLGQNLNGSWVVGRGGLGDVLARLQVNFDSLKGQMGFNNPQTETQQISLKKEFYRIKDDGGTSTITKQSWKEVLKAARVKNLWDVPEFKKYCRPFTSKSEGPQPGLVFSFPGYIEFGKNFFGRELSGGDHAYDPTNFATKVRSVGVWFEGYDNAALSETPRVYMIPTGMDVMLVPDSTDLDTREWTIVDQKLPVPLPAGDSDINNPDWIPGLDGLDGSMTQIRRYSSFRAYRYTAYLDANSEMTTDSRLVGRSVWNRKWMLIIPGGTFLYDQNQGLNTFIDDVTDIKLLFQTYAISGN